MVTKPEGHDGRGTMVLSCNPEVVTKAALPLLARFMGICQYPEDKSNVLNHFAVENTLRESSVHSSRSAPRQMPCSLACNQCRIFGVPSFFVTSTMGEDHVLLDS